jgi:O-antigen/teichoic acid export membrane protein
MDTAWYLRSLELTRSVLLVSAVSRLAGIALLIVLVRHHDDLGRAMWSYTFVAWANAVVMWVVMFHLRIVHRPRIEVPYLRSLLRSGASIVVGNLSGSALTNGGVALLGTIADPVLIGAANLAVRIKSAGLAVLTPLSQFGFVRLSRLASAHPSAAVVLGRRMFYALISLGSLVSALILLNADLIARVAYGLPHPPAAADMMLGLIAAGIPLSLAGNLLCLQCLTLFKREGAYVCILLMAAAIFFGSMLLSPASNRAVAFGCGMLAAEAWVVLAAGILIRKTVRDQ